MRAALRSIESKHKLKKGFLCVLVARKDTTAAKSTQVEADMTAALRALDMLLDLPSKNVAAKDRRQTRTNGK